MLLFHLFCSLLQEYKLFWISSLCSYHLLSHHLSLFDFPLGELLNLGFFSLSPCTVISGVDFNSIIVILVYVKYFFILSISLFISSYGFPVNFIFFDGLQPPFHGVVIFWHCTVDTNFLIFFSRCWIACFGSVCLSSKASG